ncbi:YerC/YecD family TrpR-related protein [Thermomonas sp.]
MKQRPEPLPAYDAASAIYALAHALVSLKTADEVRSFLEDLCTPAELEAMGDRWKVVPLLLQGVPYREIHELTKVSVTTVGRVARTVDRGTGGYTLAARRLRLPLASLRTKAFP